MLGHHTCYMLFFFVFCDQGARAASRNLSSKLHKLDQESLKQQEIIYMQVSFAMRIGCSWPLHISQLSLDNSYNVASFPGASEFCSWVSENGRLVVQWPSEICLSSLVIVSHWWQHLVNDVVGKAEHCTPIGKEYFSWRNWKLKCTGPLSIWISKCFSCPMCQADVLLVTNFSRWVSKLNVLSMTFL